ncbi:MAG: Rieske 2Fe-2S domain-containing protein [Burkholderiaceae bacterium]
MPRSESAEIASTQSGPHPAPHQAPDRISTLWHPVAAEASLGDAPLACELLGQPLVLWRDAQGGLHAWADRCPHRGARLSLGQVQGNTLQCPYHGWRFAAGRPAMPGSAVEGRCILIPAASDFVPPDSHACTVFEARRAHGLLWVRLALPEDVAAGTDGYWPEPPECVDAQDASGSADAAAGPSNTGWRRVVCGPYAVQTSPGRLIENFLDLSHFGFVHAGWLGDAAHAQVDSGTVHESPHGIVAEGCRAYQPRGFAEGGASPWVDYRYEVHAPFVASLLKRAGQPGGSENRVTLCVQPLQPAQSVAWFVMATRNDPSDDASLRAFQDTVFAQDRPVIESQPPLLPIGLGAGTSSSSPREVHGPADRMSAAYRRLLLRSGIRFGVC